METFPGGLAFACLITPSFLLSSLSTKHAGKASVMSRAPTRA
jgi:hypothetical protein